MDGRRRRYVPLNCYFPLGKSMQRLYDKLGADGLLYWACLLAAAKRSPTQGTFTYTTETDGFNQLGLIQDRHQHDLDTFFRATGQLKQTTRTRVGQRFDVVLTRWKEWNDTSRTRPRDNDNPNYHKGSPHGNTNHLQTKSKPIRGRDSDSDSDSDTEGEEKDVNHPTNQKPENPITNLTDLIGKLPTPKPRTREEQLRILKGQTE